VSLLLKQPADIVIVNRPRDVRIIVNIAGSFSLVDRRDSRGERRVFACRVVNLSPRDIALATTISAKMGERVIAEIDRLGNVEGVVICELERGFVMSISASDEEREKLADKIEWVEKHKNHDASDRRGDERIVPNNPYSRMILPDGRTKACLVLDLSISGAAVLAQTVPAVGTVLAIGLVIGRVVRHFDGGFAVRFVQRQDASTVEAMVIHE
jgi:hypothetical protein